MPNIFTGSAICKRCKQVYPDSEFTIRKGWRVYVCSHCRTPEHEKFVLSRDLDKAQAKAPFRKCTTCGTLKPNDELHFGHAGNQHKTQLGNTCRSCLITIARARWSTKYAKEIALELYEKGLGPSPAEEYGRINALATEARKVEELRFHIDALTTMYRTLLVRESESTEDPTAH